MSEIGHNNPPPVSGRWIAWHTQWMDHPLVGIQNPEYCAWWLFLNCNCNYGDGCVEVNGHTVDLTSGEMTGAYRILASQMCTTIKKLRTFISKLEQYGLVTVTKKGTQKGTQKGRCPQVINLVYYNELCKYVETKRSANGHAEGQVKGTQRARKGHAEGTLHYKNTINTINTNNPPLAREPHMNGVGFVISKEWDLSIPSETVEKWRSKYDNIADLEAELKRLAVDFMGSSTAVGRFREFPHLWFERILSKENKKEAPRGKRKTTREIMQEADKND